MAKASWWRRRHDRVHASEAARDVDQEFAFHLEQRVEEFRNAGQTEDAAREGAMKRFGDIHGARQAYISLAARRRARQSAIVFMHSWLADARYALRVFRRSPGFAFGIVLVAGLGISINSAVFATLNALFMRPLPVPRPHEIVRVYTSESGNSGLYGASSYPDYLDLQHVPSLRGLTAYVPLAANVRLGSELVRAEGRLVSENFFEVLELRAGAGRVFSARGATAAGGAPVVLGHAFWRRQFAADPAVVGRTIEVNGGIASVVGVLPRDFVGIEPAQVDLYLPASTHRTVAPGFEFVDDRRARLVRLVGRLAPSVTEARAANDLNLVMRALGTTYPDTNQGRVVTVTSGSALIDTTASQVRLVPIITLVFSVTGVLLLIATINVAGLLLARTVARRRELAVRLSLGASRFRMLRQLITESLLLGLMAEGVALAVLAALPAIARALSLPETVQVGVDLRVLAFASVVTLVTALGFSIGPALKGSDKHPYNGLREGTATMPLSRARGQQAMVVAQVALSITLLSAAALLGQSIRRQYAVSPGFETAHVLAAEFEAERGIPSRDEERAFGREVLEQARQLPGVLTAAVTVSPPLTSEGARMTIDIPGFRAPRDEALEVAFSYAGTDYCATLGLRILEGDELRSGGGGAKAARAVLVNESMAKAYWRGRSPVGSTITLGGASGTSVPVIGVVADARMISLSQPAGPHFYIQSDDGPGSSLLVRTRTPASPLKPVVLRTFAGGVNAFLLRRVRTMDEVMGESLAEAKAFAAATAAGSVMALILAASALYSLVSYLAAQRRREFGIRIALGATSADVVRLVLSSAIRLSAVGVGIGLLTTLGSTAAMQALVFAVPAADVATVLGIAALAGAVVACACAVPALRAAGVPPSATLRVD